MNGILKAPQAAPVQSVNGRTGNVMICDLYTTGGVKALQVDTASGRSYYVIGNRNDNDLDRPTAAFYGEAEGDDVRPMVRTERRDGAGAVFQQIYTNYNKPTASDVGAVPTSRKVNGKALTGDITVGVVGVRELTVTSASIAAGSTGTGSASFSAISGATRYVAALRGAGSVYGWVLGTSISGTTLTATFYNASNEAHTIATTFLILGVAE